MTNSKLFYINQTIGAVLLSDGKTTIEVPRLDMKKIVNIVKFIGMDGIRIYSRSRELLMNDELTTFERLISVIEELKEEQLIRVISIILDVPDEEALKLDLNETLDILILISENTNLQKTYKQIQMLSKILFHIDLPDFQNVIKQRMDNPVTADNKEV